MAKVINEYIGQLSGKLGGMVFARNKSGSYVRAGVKGINPRTVAQIQARNAFANIASLFRGLTSAEKTQWQEFADNFYAPRSGGNTGQFSAYNAFIALRSVVRNNQELNVPVTYASNVGSISTFVEEPMLPMPATPVGKAFTPSFELSAGGATSLSLGAVVIHADGKFKIEILMDGGATVSLYNTITPEGYEVGYAVYLSNGNPSQGMTYNNEFAQCLGYIQPMVNTDAGVDLVNINSLEFETTTALDIGKFRRFPLIDEYALLTVYALNKYGMMTPIGSQEMKVVA